MPLVLEVESGVLARSRFTITAGPVVLGREQTCPINFGIDEARRISRRHAVVSFEQGRYRIADQHSTNGTLVNGRRIDSVDLSDGDVIELGPGGPKLSVSLPAEPPQPQPAPPAPPQVPRRTMVDGALYDPAKDKGRKHSPITVVAMFLMVGAGAVAGLLVALMTLFSLGPVAALAGLVVAFAPAPIYLAMWLWLDRYDPEPAWALAACLIWGGGAATLVSGIVNDMSEAVVMQVTSHAALASFVGTSISAPLIEEGMKAVAVLVIFLVLRREFDGVIDGIMYAGVVALGFATVENVLYYGRVTAAHGVGGLVGLFVLRGILGPFGHSVYTAMTGIGFGIARQSHNRVVQFAAPVVGFGCAVFLHALWNTLCGFAGTPLAFMAIYFVVWVPLFVVFLGVVIWMGFREAKLIERMLAREVDYGLLSADQAAITASWPRRVMWQLASLGDLQRLSARREFLYAATRLALSYWHIERANAAGGVTMSLGRVPRFRSDLQRLASAI